MTGIFRNLLKKLLIDCQFSNENNDSEIIIKYYPKWDNLIDIKPNSLDMIISQAALEHVDDLERSYDILYKWLT